MTIFEMIGNIFNGLYNAFNVTIPGFHLSISQVFITLFIISTIIIFFRFGSGRK